MRLFSFLLLSSLVVSACVPSASFSSFVAPPAYAEVAPVIVLDQEISFESLRFPARQLRAATEPVTIIINSPGGEVYAGLRFIEEMREAQKRGVSLTCVVDGMAASMAAVILQACDLRLMKRQSSILFHTVSISGTDGGNQWDYQRLVQTMKDLNKRLAIFVVGRLKISMAQYEAKVADTDWWLGYEEALEVGAVDGVL